MGTKMAAHIRIMGCGGRDKERLMKQVPGSMSWDRGGISVQASGKVEPCLAPEEEEHRTCPTLHPAFYKPNSYFLPEW